MNRKNLRLIVDNNHALAEARYQAALKLVAYIDIDLTRGIRHYHNSEGDLLTTLDEVIRAILDGDLMTGPVELELAA